MTYEEARNILLLRSCSDCKHFDMDTADCDWGIFEECTEAYYTAIQALQEPERKKGHWIGDFGNSEYNDWHCSNCRRYYPERNKKLLGDYCPWCGADMRGEEE